MAIEELKGSETGDIIEPPVLEPVGASPKPPTQRKRPAKKPKAKSRATARPEDAKKGGPRRPYPRVTLEESTRIPLALKEKNGGNPWPPADVARAVGLSHKNTDFFYLAAASRDFGLTEGSRDSDQIALTEFGRDRLCSW